MAKRFLRMIALIGLVFALMLTTACQKPETSSGMPDGKTIELYESLYGKPAEDVIAALKLSESDYKEDSTDPTYLILNEKSKLGGREFTEKLRFSFTDEPKVFLGVVYTLHENDLEELALVTETLFKDLKSVYGETSTPQGYMQRISKEENIEQIKKGIENVWKESWKVGENTQVLLRVSTLENEGIITLYCEEAVIYASD